MVAAELRWGLVAFVSVAIIAITTVATINLGSVWWLTKLLGFNSVVASGFGVLSATGLAYPFVLGVAATFNPCGFVMLPAYLAIYLQDDKRAQTGAITQLSRGLLVSIAMGFGVLTMFGTVGLVISLGIESVAGVLAGAFEWAGLAIGGLMVGLGIYLLAGGVLYANWALRASGRIGGAQAGGLRAYYLFGLSFAIASLGCTLPLFIVLIANSFVAQGFIAALAGFLLYAFGMFLTITVLTLITALFKSSITSRLQKAARYLAPVSGILVTAVGVYLLSYWLVVSQLGEYLRFLKF